MLLFVGLTGSILTSCHKEDIKPTPKGKAEVNYPIQTRDGDDDEESIILGIVKDNGTPQQDVRVNLIPEFNTVPIDQDTTDVNGDFEVGGEDGNYFFELIETNGDTTTTNVFTLSGDTTMTIEL